MTLRGRWQRSPGSAPLFDSIRVAILAAVVGVVVAYGALAFLWLLGILQGLFFGSEDGRLYALLERLPIWRIVVAPIIGGLLVGVFVWRFMPEARNQGPADVIYGVQEQDGHLSMRVGLYSALASAVSIGAGASVGRYGPAVHLGASLSAWVSTVLGLDRGQRIALVGSGVAAAIAASFNAPLGGILFATEVVLAGRALRAFMPVTIAAVVATAVARSHGNSFHLFDLSVHRIENLYEYVVFAAVGAVGGLLAVAYTKSLQWAARTVAASGLPVWARPMVGGVLLGLIGTQFPQVMGLGEDVLWDAFLWAFPVGLLLALVAFKLLATSISLGFGFSGGVFAPALYVGALFGLAVGAVLLGWFPDLVSSPAIYAVAGMGAVVSCVIGAPIATVLIAFELTSSYPLSTAVMLAVVMSHLVARRIFPYSYFAVQLAERNVDIETRREAQIMRGRILADVMVDDYQALRGTTTVAEAVQLCIENPEQALLLVDAEHRLMGEVSVHLLLQACREGRGERQLSEIATSPDVVLDINADLHEAMQRLRDFVGISVPVVDEHDNGRVCGVIFENTVIRAYHDAVDQARNEEQGAK